jgi:type I restriction enzyme S subunit
MLPYPDRYTQQKIGRIYFEMCSKIEMNRRINETLEAIARAMFTSWFVDFDLVGAKTAGVGVPHVGAKALDLFRGSFRNGIPADWEWKPLSAICEINSRVLKNVEQEYELEYVDIGSAGRGHVFETQIFRFADAPSRARRLVKDGDTVVSTVRPGNRAYFFVVNPPKNLVVSTGYAVLTPKPNARALTYLNVTRDETIDRLDQIANGGAYPAVTSEQVASIEVVWPGEHLASAFEKLVNPLLSKIAANESASRILASVRDALLPKLVSGEICLKACRRPIGAEV